MIIIDAVLGKIRSTETPKTIGDAVKKASESVPAEGDYLLFTYRDVLKKIEYNDFLGIFNNVISIPASAFISRTDNGATFQIDESSTNKVNQVVFVFGYAADSFIQIALPNDKSIITTNFKATITGKRYSAGDANYGVAWAIQGLIRNDDDAIDTAFGTAVVVTDTYTADTDEYVSAQSVLITAAGTIGNNSNLYLQILRDVSDAGDTLVGDAGLIAVQIEFNLEA